MSKNFWDWAFKILSALVIPLLLWGIKLEVRLAVQDQQIEVLQQDVKNALGIKETVSANAVLLGRMEEKLTATIDTLREVKAILQSNSR